MKSAPTAPVWRRKFDRSIRKVNSLDVRRRRSDWTCISSAKNCTACCGFDFTQRLRSPRNSSKIKDGPIALARADRVASSISAISPKNSPGSRSAMSRRTPPATRLEILMRPLDTK